MPVRTGLTTTIPSGTSYFRITSPSLNTTNPADHVKVVNGQGSVRSWYGGRYNGRGVVTVYLTEDIETCLAEKMFYFHREILRGIDTSHITGAAPPFNKTFILWEVTFSNAIADIFDMMAANAFTQFNIFPSLSLNPSQDYIHLKEKRADIQSTSGYNGIRVPSSRTTKNGNMVVLFDDQSRNLRDIRPYEVEFQLITDSGAPFSNHANEILHFTSGKVRILPRIIPGLMTPALPSGGNIYQNWQTVNFHH